MAIDEATDLSMRPLGAAPVPPPAAASALEAAERPRAPGTFAALRHRNYQLYIGGQLISVAGTFMQFIAQGWLVYQLTNSELALGIVGFASAIPALLVSAWGGVVVDRMSKRTLLVITQASAMVLAFVLAALTFSGRVQVWHVVALSALTGFVNAFDGPARQAFVVEMVGRDDLPNAIALNSLMYNSARIVGPAIGGVLLATFGAAWCFVLNGVTFLAVIAGLLAMRLQPRQPAKTTSAAWKQLTGGLDYVYHHLELFALLLLALSFSVFGISYSTILPAFADKMLHTSAAGYGALNVATGVGAGASAFFIARSGGRMRRGRLLTWAALLFPLALFAFGYATSMVIALPLIAIIGAGFMIQFTLMNTLLQLQVSDEMRGRVMGLYMLALFGVSPFGNLIIGRLAEAWGLTWAIGLSAVVTLGFSVVILALVPRVRHLP